MVVWLKPCESRSSPGALPETLSPTGLRVSFCLQFDQRHIHGREDGRTWTPGPSGLMRTRLDTLALVLVLVRSAQQHNACGEAAWIDRFLVRLAAQPGVVRRRYA